MDAGLNKKEIESRSPEETERIAAGWLADIARAHADRDEALVVGLSGHLGAGKTAFVKAVAKALGVSEDVTSPTFVLMKLYDIAPTGALEDFPWKRLVHIDAYRLERREELDALEWEKLVADRNGLIMIEWPENVGDPLKEIEGSLRISFEAVDEKTRRIVFR
ncbi:MAG: tRNA (adenosine(37)-N6)-threonylcarbamoyltransferase complex ATPase subunit type 1 TsaE [Patescibacteria group bacterium]|nr:tRNA (adenosine(37)-N6)-threonylcarbamoyltransferase complex ATPase subunit type 1 TsaE [Patescibacteria group bacterium]